MDGQINSGNIIIGIAIVLVVVFMAYNLGQERSNRSDSFVDPSTGGVPGKDVHFITARTYGLVPKTVSDSARTMSVKAGGSGSLYGVGADSKILHARPQQSEVSINPLLQHQRLTSMGNVPTVRGDPIRTPTYIGPSVRGYSMGSYNQPWKPAYGGLTTNPTIASEIAQVEESAETAAERPQAPIEGQIDSFRHTYDIGSRGPGGPDSLGPGSGPYPGMPMGVPVPRGTLKKTSEKYGYPFYKASRPLKPYDYFKPFGPNQNVNQDANYVDTPFYARQQSRVWDNPVPGLEYDRYPGYGATGGYSANGSIPFIGSVDAFAPFPEVLADWEKTGMLTTKDPEKGGLLNLYRMPVAPLQDLFKYTVQDKDGFIIPLKENYLEDGDTVPEVLGKEQMGPWVANIFTQNKYIWV